MCREPYHFWPISLTFEDSHLLTHVHSIFDQKCRIWDYRYMGKIAKVWYWLKTPMLAVPLKTGKIQQAIKWDRKGHSKHKKLVENV